MFRIRGQDQSLNFNQRLLYLDSFRLSVCLNDEFDLWHVYWSERVRASWPSCYLIILNYMLAFTMNWRWACGLSYKHVVCSIFIELPLMSTSQTSGDMYICPFVNWQILFYRIFLCANNWQPAYFNMSLICESMPLAWEIGLLRQTDMSWVPTGISYLSYI